MNPQKREIPRTVAVAMIAASLCSFLNAQPPPQPPPGSASAQATAPADSPGGLSHHDRAFLRKAVGGGMKEIDISRAVMDRLTNSQAKDMARMMISDHTAANEALTGLAANKGVKLPAEDVTVSDDWSKKTGDIDSLYAKEMVSDHMGAVKLFESASKSDDPDIAAFAQKTLPTLQHHLMMAQDLAKSLN
jgi:putative membrane protein